MGLDAEWSSMCDISDRGGSFKPWCQDPQSGPKLNLSNRKMINLWGHKPLIFGNIYSM